MICCPFCPSPLIYWTIIESLWFGIAANDIIRNIEQVFIKSGVGLALMASKLGSFLSWSF